MSPSQIIGLLADEQRRSTVAALRNDGIARAREALEAGDPVEALAILELAAELAARLER